MEFRNWVHGTRLGCVVQSSQPGASPLGIFLAVAAIVLVVKSPKKLRTLGRMAIAFVVTVLLFIILGAMLRMGDPQSWGGISVLVGLLVAVIVGWGYTCSLGRVRATALRQAEGFKTSGPGMKSQAKVPANFRPTPKWKPGVPVDIPRTVAAFLYYFERKKTLVVFAHGTCVPVSPGCAEPEKEAMQALRGVFYSHPDFRTLPMDDGNYMISYSDAAFSVVFRDELDANRDYIEQHHREGLTEDEVLQGPTAAGGGFEERGKIGLFGRSRMFLDAQNSTVSEIWRAESSATG